MVNKVRHTELGDIPVDWKIQTFEETFRDCFKFCVNTKN